MLSPGLRLVLLFLCVTPFELAFAESPATPPPNNARTPRNWTTSDGQVFQATLTDIQDTKIIVRLANGQMATFPILRLSLSDQVYLKNSLAPATPMPAAPGAAQTPPPLIAKTDAVPPPEKRQWPVKVEVDSRAIEVKTVSESVQNKEYIYRSQVFQFTSQDKLAGSVMKEIARTFEATHALVQALPWGIDPHPPADLGFYQAKFYVDRESYMAAGGPKNSGGVYFSSDRIFRVPFPSLGLELRGKTWFKDEKYSNETIVHEITHQMMHDFIPFLPIWAIEGMAEYDAMIPYNAGSFLTGAHDRGLRDYIKKGQLEGLAPSAMGPVMNHITMTSESWHEKADNGGREQHRLYFTSAMLVYYFSHLDGDGKGTRFLKYLDKIREARDAWDTFFKNPRVKVDPDGGFSYPRDLPLPSQQKKDAYGIEQLSVLLDGRTPEQLQQQVVEGFKKIGVKL